MNPAERLARGISSVELGHDGAARKEITFAQNSGRSKASQVLIAIDTFVLGLSDINPRIYDSKELIGFREMSRLSMEERFD